RSNYLCFYLYRHFFFSFFFFNHHVHILDLHSFPTRRSSDLGRRRATRTWCARAPASGFPGRATGSGTAPHRPQWSVWSCPRSSRSEEHTSELQSQSNLVCRLLLEKKKKKKKNNKRQTKHNKI